MDLHTKHGRMILSGIVLVAAGILLSVAAFFDNTMTLGPSGIPPLAAAGSVLLVVGGVVLFIAYQEDRGKKINFSFFQNAAGSAAAEAMPKIPKEGYIQAVVIGISRNLRMEGEPESYHVVCEYREPESGRKFTYSSEALRSYPGKELIGKKVRVYLDAHEAGNYRVDLESIEK